VIENPLRFRDISRIQAFLQAGKERRSRLGYPSRDRLMQLFKPMLNPTPQLHMNVNSSGHSSLIAQRTIESHRNHSSMLVDDL